MIIIISLSILAIILAEFFLFKQKSKQKGKIEGVKTFNTQLEILKALSYIPLSKHHELLDDLNDFSASFFIQNKFSAFTLITNQNKTNKAAIWRYEENQPVKQKGNFFADIKLNSLEEFLLSETKQQKSSPVIINNLTGKLKINSDLPAYQSAVVVPLVDNDLKFGYLMLFSREESEVDRNEANFLNIVGKICTMVMFKWFICSKLSLEEQFKAVDIIW